MVSKGDLGVTYLVSVGVVLFGAFSAGMLLPFDAGGAAESRSLLGLSMGIMIAGSFLVTGVGLARSTLDDDRVWRVAGWSTVGLGIPTVLTVLVTMLAPWLLSGIGWRSIVLVNIAAGGVVGVLVGSLLELRAEHERTQTLNQRNTVFLRLFRHDIRTSVNIVRGHIDLMMDGGNEGKPLESVDVMRDHLQHIERLSNAASRLDDLESMTETEPVDLGAVVRDRLDAIRHSTDDVTFETELASEAYVEANDLLASVVDNLVRNAVEHGSTSPQSHAPEDAVGHGSTDTQTNAADSRIWVTVQPAEGRRDAILLRIEDDGPGFDDTELAVHAEATETALQHSDGIGLWLVRWIVDTYDGAVDLRNAPEGGAVVIVTLPVAESDPVSDESQPRAPTIRDVTAAVHSR